jgi:hypothetical protein
MKFLLYNLDEPILVVSAIDSDYNPTFVTNEDYAMQFGTVAEADAVGNIINDPIEFVGTRPVRKPK